MEHVLQLYQEEHCLLDALAEFVAAGLREDEGIVVVGSTPARGSFGIGVLLR